jgi:Spy/CpxP family protein refolding chaperone
MKSIRIVAAIALAATVLRAEEPPPAVETPPPAEPAPQDTRAKLRKETGAQLYIDHLDPIVQLTDEQKERITTICDTSHKFRQEFLQKNAERSRAADKAVQDAYASGDEEAQKRAMEEYQILHEPVQKSLLKSYEDLKKVLTREQRTKLYDHQAMQTIKNMTEPATLKPDQVRQIKNAYREAMENPDPENPINIMNVIAEVLTPEQAHQIKKYRAVNYVKQAFAPAKLTEEQMKRAERLCEDILRDPDIGDQSYDVIQQRVSEILTREQREAMNPPNPLHAH